MTDSCKGIAMLAAPSNRSRIYLDLLKRNHLLPERVILLNDPSVETPEQRSRSEIEGPVDEVLPEDPDLDPRGTVAERLTESGIPYESFDTLDPNEPQIVNAVAELDQSYLIYSGPGGTILESELLNTGPDFIHVHSGWLPEYRGSTTIYYSLLNGDGCGVSAFLMNENIDEGNILKREVYPPPTDPETIDLYCDPWIRAKLLVDLIDQYDRNKEFSRMVQDSTAGETYHIIHPVLKYLSVMGVQESQ